MLTLRHIHKRKHAKLQPYPHPKFKYRLLDFFVYLVSITGPALTIPQIYHIYSQRSARDISPVTWGAYIISSLVWEAYGIVHKDKPIAITNAVWILLNILIFIGAILYH